MLSLRSLSRRLCSRCLESHKHSRNFQTVSEAITYHETVSVLYQPSSTLPQHSAHLPYLTSLIDLDIRETVESLPEGEVTAALQVLLTQAVYQISWTKLKRVLSDLVQRDPSNSSLVLAGTITYHVMIDCTNKLHRSDRRKSRTEDENIWAFQTNSNLDRIIVAFYWIQLNKLHLAKRCFEGVTLTDELECFLVMKALLIFPLNYEFTESICNDIVKCEDTAKLAAKLAFFEPTKFKVISQLLFKNRATATDKFTQFVVYASRLTRSYKAILDLVQQFKVPGEELKQVCLNLHHAREDKLFYTTFLAIPSSEMFDLFPIISCRPSSDSKTDHVVHAALSFFKLSMRELVPVLLNRISEKGFVYDNLTKDEWIMRLLETGEKTLTADDYGALLSSMSSLLRAKLLKKSIEEGKKFTFLQQIIVASYEDETLDQVLLDLLKLVGTLGAADYIDDCLIHSLPNLPAATVLAITRYLADHDIINSYQRNFWMLVGYELKGDSLQLVQNIVSEELYPTDEALYFTSRDLQNLLLLVTSDWLKCELEGKLEQLRGISEELSDPVMKHRLTRKLLEFKHLSTGFLRENSNHYKIAKRFGIHTAVCALQKVNKLTKNDVNLTELLRQIQENGDKKMMLSFLKYYGFLLPRDVKLYAEEVIGKQGMKVGRESRYEKVTQSQLYFYSYCMHMPLDESIIDLALENLKADEIVHLLVVQCVLDPEKVMTIRDILECDKYKQHYKADRNLLQWIYMSQQVESAECEEESEVEMSIT